MALGARYAGRAAEEPEVVGLTLHPDVSRVLLSADEIAERVGALGARIDEDYDGRELHVIGDDGSRNAWGITMAIR